MSLTVSEALRTGKNWPRFAILLLALPAGGCFQPLYGEAAHPGIVGEMRAIAVEPIKGNSQNTSQQGPDLDRVAHYLGNDLIADLNGTGATPEPKYRLSVTTSLTTSTPTVSSQIELANSTTMVVTAKYVLTPTGGGAEIVSGVARQATDSDITLNRFSNLRARHDDEIRLSKSLADEIELSLAAFLSDKK